MNLPSPPTEFLQFENYTLENLSPTMPSAYKNLITNLGLTDNTVLAKMIGLPNSGSVLESQPEVYLETGIGRTQNFFNFWNNDDSIDEIADFIDLYRDLSRKDSIDALTYRNLWVTYILVLVFNGILSSVNGIDVNNPLDIFTEPEDIKNFSQASVNIRIFITSVYGLGNFPLWKANANNEITPPTTGVPKNLIKENWNKGYISYLCSNEFEKRCKDKKTPYTNQECIQGFRKKLSNSPNALAWCGCFTPLPQWFEDALKNVTTVNKNTCDNFCFGGGKSETIPYFEPPLITPDEEWKNPGTKQTCTPSTVCVISDNSINAVNSTGDINFSQICQCDTSTVCLCYLNVSDPGTLDNVRNGKNGIGTQVQFDQVCSNGICYKINEKGVFESVPCNKNNTPGTGDFFKDRTDGYSEKIKYDQIYSNFWYFLIFFVVIIIIFELAYVENYRYTKRSKKI